jgi:hypothetical protein
MKPTLLGLLVELLSNSVHSFRVLLPWDSTQWGSPHVSVHLKTIASNFRDIVALINSDDGHNTKQEFEIVNMSDADYDVLTINITVLSDIVSCVELCHTH